MGRREAASEERDQRMTQAFTFTLSGPPRPWQRAARGNGRTFTAPETAAYQRALAYACLAVLPRGWPLDATYSVSIVATPKDGRCGDWDNYAKQVCDALNGIAWNDDRQVKRGTVEVSDPDRKTAGIRVRIEVMRHES